MSPTFTEEELAAMQAVAWGERLGARPNRCVLLMELHQSYPELVKERAFIARDLNQSLEWGWSLTEAGRALLEDLGRLPPNPNDGRPRPVA